MQVLRCCVLLRIITESLCLCSTGNDLAHKSIDIHTYIRAHGVQDLVYCETRILPMEYWRSAAEPDLSSTQNREQRWLPSKSHGIRATLRRASPFRTGSASLQLEATKATFAHTYPMRAPRPSSESFGGNLQQFARCTQRSRPHVGWYSQTPASVSLPSVSHKPVTPSWWAVAFVSFSHHGFQNQWTLPAVTPARSSPAFPTTPP